MSVNIYGNRLLSGKAGKDGKDGGLNLVHFIPDKIKSWFRKAEEIWLYFDTDKDAIIFDKDKKPIGLHNYGVGRDAMFGGTNFPEIKGLINNERIRIVNTKTQIEYFKFEFTKTATKSNSTVIFSISFQEISKCPDWRILFANDRCSRGVAVKSGKLQIFCGENRQEIEYDATKFCILFLEYNCFGENTKCFYDTGDRHGKIECDKKPSVSKHVYFGGFPDVLGANHQVATFEMHYTPYISRLTDDMRDLLRKDIKTKIG